MSRIFGLVALLVLAALAVSPAAIATTATGQQNPDLEVTVSLTPDRATDGDVVGASGTVVNVSGKRQSVTITAVLVDPTGASTSTSRTVALKAGESWTYSANYTVRPDDPRGTYELTVSATAKNGTSTATATVEYF